MGEGVGVGFVVGDGVGVLVGGCVGVCVMVGCCGVAVIYTPATFGGEDEALTRTLDDVFIKNNPNDAMSAPKVKYGMFFTIHPIRCLWCKYTHH